MAVFCHVFVTCLSRPPVQPHPVIELHCHQPRLTVAPVEENWRTVLEAHSVPGSLIECPPTFSRSTRLTSICTPGRPTRSGVSPKERDPPRSISYPWWRRRSASSRSPSAPLRCDDLPMSFTCLWWFCGAPTPLQIRGPLGLKHRHGAAHIPDSYQQRVPGGSWTEYVPTCQRENNPVWENTRIPKPPNPHPRSAGKMRPTAM